MQSKRQEAAEEKLSEALKGQVVAYHGKYADVKKGRVVFHCKLRQNLGNIVVGDQVIFQIRQKNNSEEKIGVITAIENRKSKIWRMDERKQEKLIAANVDQIYIVMAPTPEPSWLLLDSYLAAAQYLDIKAVIVFNKIDLVQKDFEKKLEVYDKLNIPYLMTSVLIQQGIDKLTSSMINHCSIFVGQSGVGKSSLIKQLLPEESIEIGDLHEASKLGTHTTSTSKLYDLPKGGKLIDSPGIREFSLWPMTGLELSKAFVEFEPYQKLCKFRDCTHKHEPDCAIQIAVSEGKIAFSRLQNYHILVERFKR